MKTIKTILIIVFGLTVVNVSSQDLSPEQLEMQKNRVQILTLEEQWDTQIWYFQEVEKMNLSEEESEEYSSNLLLYMSKIKRLDDLDKDYNYEEVLIEMNKLIKKLNTKVKSFLSQDSYDQHLKTINTLHDYILGKMQREEYLVKL